MLIQDGSRTRWTSFEDLVAELKNRGAALPLQLVTPQYCGTNAITGLATLNPANGTVHLTCTNQFVGRTMRVYVIPSGLIFSKFVS